MHYRLPSLSLYFAGSTNRYADNSFYAPGCRDTSLAVSCLFLWVETGVHFLKKKLYKNFSLKRGNNSCFPLSNLSFLSRYSPFVMPPTFHSILIYLSSGYVHNELNYGASGSAKKLPQSATRVKECNIVLLGKKCLP
jgi:hypothetical protein